MHGLLPQLLIGDPLYELKEAWDTDLGNSIQETNWQQLWKSDGFTSALMQEMQGNIIQNQYQWPGGHWVPLSGICYKSVLRVMLSNCVLNAKTKLNQTLQKLLTLVFFFFCTDLSYRYNRKRGLRFFSSNKQASKLISLQLKLNLNIIKLALLWHIHLSCLKPICSSHWDFLRCCLLLFSEICHPRHCWYMKEMMEHQVLLLLTICRNRTYMHGLFLSTHYTWNEAQEKPTFWKIKQQFRADLGEGKLHIAWSMNCQLLSNRCSSSKQVR